MKDVVRQTEISSKNTESGKLFLLNEGLFNMNSSSLSLIDFDTQFLQEEFFRKANNRGLGDTANDMMMIDGKLWVIVSVSSSIEVIDPKTGISFVRVPVLDSDNKSRQPRNISLGNNKIYVCCFDSTVLEINPETYCIDKTFKAGRNPDGICFADNKIYVSNSGGLDAPNYDNTVSIIDPQDPSLNKILTVGENPYTIHADSENDVYVICRGQAGSNQSKLKRIYQNKLDTAFIDLSASDFIIQNDTAYIYYYDFTTGNYNFSVLDCLKEELIADHSLTGAFNIQVPYGISRNPLNGHLYITDAMNYTLFGKLLCFDKMGNFLYEIKQVGLNPRKIEFWE